MLLIVNISFCEQDIENNGKLVLKTYVILRISFYS